MGSLPVRAGVAPGPAPVGIDRPMKDPDLRLSEESETFVCRHCVLFVVVY